MKDKYNVVRLLLLRCSFLYTIYFSHNSTVVLREYISCSNVEEFSWISGRRILRASFACIGRPPSSGVLETQRTKENARDRSVRVD